MKIPTKLATVLAGVALVGVLAGCGATTDYQDRKESQDKTTLQDSQALRNLEEKRDRENDPNKVRYLYVMSFGDIIGYYVTKGNITSNAAQIAPEDDIVQPWSGGERYVVDSAQDDGTYGDGDPGVFFFTADGMVVTSLDYIQSDQPLAIDVPRLGGTE
jgi:hypothetical protein